MEGSTARVGLVFAGADEPLARELSQLLGQLDVSSRLWPAEGPAGAARSAELLEEASQQLKQSQLVVILFSSASLQDAAMIGRLRVLAHLAARADPPLSILPVALGVVRGRIPRDALQWLLPYQPRRLALTDTGLASPAELRATAELVRDFGKLMLVTQVSESSFDSLSPGPSTIPSPAIPFTSPAPPVSAEPDDEAVEELDEADITDALDDEEFHEIDEDEDTDIIQVPGPESRDG